MLISFEAVVEVWNGFFHAPESPAAIGVFRVFWGALLLVNAALLAPHARLFFGPHGWFSARRFQNTIGRSRFTLFHVLPETNGSAYLVLAVHALAAASLCAGFHTRASALVAFATLVSLSHRNPAVGHSGDALLRLMTFLLIFSRAGQAYSVDRWLASDGDSARLTGDPGSPWCERLMQLQVCVVYIRTVFWKLRCPLWRDGTAAYFPLQLENFQRWHPPRFLQRGVLLRLATWGTLAIEASLGTLIWFRECRYPVLAAGVTLHLGLELVLNLQLFGWTMIVCFILFVPPQDMTWLLAAILGAP